MKIFIKNNKEIKKIRNAGIIAAEVLKMIEKYIFPGVTTEKINYICHEYITKEKMALSASLGYQGFPKSICTSRNDVVCHGIPNNNEILKEGDILNIDIAIIKDGYYADTSKMFFVGEPNLLAKRLCDVTKKSLYLGIEMVRPGITLNSIGSKIQKYIESNKFSVVRKYCGHGIGKNFHEYPHVLHYKSNYKQTILEPGMVFTIEPMVNIGSYHVQNMKDGWTVKTKDGSLSAQYEHTIAVTKNGYEILTLLEK